MGKWLFRIASVLLCVAIAGVVALAIVADREVPHSAPFGSATPTIAEVFDAATGMTDCADGHESGCAVQMHFLREVGGVSGSHSA